MSVDTITTVPVVIRLPHQVADATVHVQIHTDDATFDAILAEHPGAADEIRVFPATEGLMEFRSVQIDLDGQWTKVYGTARERGASVEAVA